MIIAKTGMSEVPERCFSCKYYTTNRSICTITGGYYHNSSMADRPSWCPLEEREEVKDND